VAPAAPPPPADGVTALGLPITQRGNVGVDVAVMELDGGVFGGGGGQFVATPAIHARGRLVGALFADVRFASAAFLFPGNLLAGVDYIATLRPKTWLTLGGALGLPLAQAADQTLSYGLTSAFWNIHEYMSSVVPIRIDVGFEMVRGAFGVRVEIQPVVLIPIDRPNAEVELTLQHAAEVQYGHSLGVGVRLQGVGYTFGRDDIYQAAIEPFVVLRRELGFARLGVMKTLNEESGSPYRDAWGARLSTGIHID
jgi:hypothetical protein